MAKNDFLDESEQHVEIDLFQKTCGGIIDPTLIVLKVHLLTEYYLERLIHVSLKRGDRLINDGRLSYQQKLVLVHSLDILEDSTIQCLKNLNKIRNEFAHEISKQIEVKDIEFIARPLGQICSKYRAKSKNNSLIFLHGILAYICGLLGGLVAYHEKRIIAQSDKKRFVSKALSKNDPNNKN